MEHCSSKHAEKQCQKLSISALLHEINYHYLKAFGASGIILFKTTEKRLVHSKHLLDLNNLLGPYNHGIFGSSNFSFLSFLPRISLVLGGSDLELQM